MQWFPRPSQRVLPTVYPLCMGLRGRAIRTPRPFSSLTVFDTVGMKRDKTASQSLALSESAISVTPWLL
jgi:hypothetical protein